MKIFRHASFLVIAVASAVNSFAQNADLKALFKDPPSQYKRMPYFFSNSKNDEVNTYVTDETYTRFPLKLNAINSVFVLGD